MLVSSRKSSQYRVVSEHTGGGSSPDVGVREGFPEDRTHRVNPSWPTEAAAKEGSGKLSAVLLQEMTRPTAQ